MKTSELLEHIAGSMLDDRAALLAGASDELFKNSTIIKYLNAGENLLCRDGWVLEDLTTAACCTIQLVLNTSDYSLHKSILHVKSVRLSDSDVDLIRVGYEDNRLHPAGSVIDPDYWDVNVIQTETAGRPQRYSTDMGTRTLRVRYKPDATAAALQLRLAVVRLPIVPMSEDLPDKEPEVPEEHHLDLCKYAAGTCLTSTADIDAELRSLGRSWVNEFMEVVRKAKRDRDRLTQSPPQFRFGGWAR